MKIQEANRELEKQRKNVHPIYNAESKVEKGIKELETKLSTHSWSKSDEQRLLKEIQQVRNSRPFFEKMAEFQAKVTELKEERETAKRELDGPNKIIASLKKRIDAEKGAEF